MKDVHSTTANMLPILNLLLDAVSSISATIFPQINPAEQHEELPCTPRSETGVHLEYVELEGLPDSQNAIDIEAEDKDDERLVTDRKRWSC
jgi:hypothetical protein